MQRRTGFYVTAGLTVTAVLWASGVGGGIKFFTPLDGPQVGAFGRFRVAEAAPLISSQFQYNLNPLLWQSVVTGGATAAQLPNEASVLMTVSTNGDKIVRQTYSYWRYQPGKSQQVFMTGVMGAIKAGIRQRIGYFDTANGVFFEENGTTLNVVQRSSTSGSPVDTVVTQANWNLDKMDGTGPSGTNLNMADAQIFVIDFQWLGAGRVRFGFDIGGTIVYCHQMLNANALPNVYMTTANLPLRYSLEMTSATTATSMRQICQAVNSEGGQGNETGYLFSANNGITTISSDHPAADPQYPA